MITKTAEIKIEDRKGRYGPERWYKTPDGNYPSVTTVIHQMCGLKSGILINWATARVTDQVIDEAFAHNPDNFPDLEGYRRVIKASLKDYKRADKAAMESAGDIGTEVHRRISDYLSGGTDQAPGVNPTFEKWRDWWGSKPRKAIMIEEPVWNKLSGYAGTIDCVAEVDGEATLYDWKTSSGIYVEHHLQASAYKEAAEFFIDKPQVIDRTIIVHIPKNGGKVTEHPLGQISKGQTIEPESMFDAFVGLLEAWRILIQPS